MGGGDDAEVVWDNKEEIISNVAKIIMTEYTADWYNHRC